jgi:hypothetical integral membrane protein (TIGR02206 family)
LWGPAHLIATGLTFAAPLAAAGLKQRLPAADRFIRYAFAGLLSGGWICWYVMFGLRGWLVLGNELPLNLCDWAAVALIITLVAPNQRGYELGYFWGLCGTLQGIVTPDVHREFPDPEFIFFFIGHGGIIAAILYLTFGTGLRPQARSLPRVILATFFYVAVAGTADWLWNVNYGFLRAKPDNVSLLDLLSPWPWYIPELAVIGFASVLFYYAPFFVHDRLARARAPA